MPASKRARDDLVDGIKVAEDIERMQLLQAREKMYEFLSYAYTQNPSASFLDSLRSIEFSTGLEELRKLFEGVPGSEELLEDLAVLRIAASFSKEREEEILARLQEDHVRIFRGICRGYGPPPPYESVYRSDIVMSDAPSDVLTLYHKAGLEVRGGEPPDHIGFELGFMAYLCKKEAEYRIAADLKNVTDFISFQNDFLSDHILTWVPQFCTKVLDYDNAFYAAVAELTLSWLLLEEKNTNDRNSS